MMQLDEWAEQLVEHRQLKTTARSFGLDTPELASEIYVGVAEHPERVEDVLADSRMLRAIARNKAIDLYRKRNRLPSRTLSIQQHSIDRAANDPGVDAAPLQGELAMVCRQAILNLPLKYREVLESFYFRELKLREYAIQQGLSENAVKTRLRRARSMLKNDSGLRKYVDLPNNQTHHGVLQ